MTAYIVLTLYSALTAVYLLFLLRVRQGLHWVHAHPAPVAGDDRLPSVSVIVPMRNERRHVASLLASLSGQDYPPGTVEYLLVDDHSDDGTAEEARRLSGGVASVRVLQLPEGSDGGKKAAVTYGVESARYPVIVTTDADCTHSSSWLRGLASMHADGADLVAGAVLLEHDGSMFGRLQSLEFLGLVGVGAGLFGVGYPRICNAASFSYRKADFHAVDGFGGNDHLPGGDDEFLLHKLVYGMGRQAEFSADPAALVRTSSAPSLRAFLSQRIRWASKGRSYDDSRFVSFLIVLFIFFLFTSVAPLLLFLSPVAGAGSLVLFAVKILADLSVLIPTAALLRRPLRGMDILVAELLHAPYLVLVSLLGFFGTFRWKQRTFRATHR